MGWKPRRRTETEFFLIEGEILVTGDFMDGDVYIYLIYLQ